MPTAEGGLVFDAVSLIAGRCEGVSSSDQLMMANLGGYITAMIHLVRKHVTEPQFSQFSEAIEDVIRRKGGEALLAAVAKHLVPIAAH